MNNPPTSRENDDKGCLNGIIDVIFYVIVT